MKITDVKINLYEKDNLRAFASITIDDAFVVKGFRVLNGKNGLFVSCPSSMSADGEYYDNAYPLTAEGREMLTKAVLYAYDAEIDRNAKPSRNRR